MPALTFETFEKLMVPFCIKPFSRIAVGVSGGADSLCLALFLNQWAKEKNVSLTALTVNHNLRSEAAAEAEQTHNLLAKYGIEHHTLVNQTTVPQSGIESYARQVRYQLLTTYCSQNGIEFLFLAHHLSDQAETFLLRLSKSSSLKGLSGMRPQTRLNGVSLCRPFLGVKKEALTEALLNRQIDWAEDKMNQDTRFERVRWRQFLPNLEKAGLSLDAVSQSMRRLARADEALDFYAQAFIQKEVWIDFRGFARVPFDKWQKRPQEEKIRIMELLVRCIGQNGGYISLHSLENLCEDLPASKTLGGCVFKMHRTGLFISREVREMDSLQKLHKGKTIQWDRFLITSFVDGFVCAGAPKDKILTIPKSVQNTFPAVFVQKELEKPVQIDYKEKNDSHVKIEFIGKCKDSGNEEKKQLGA